MKRAISILGLLFLAGCGGGGKDPQAEVNRWLDLEIVRPEVEVPEVVFENEFGEPDENGLITNTCRIHPAVVSVPMVPESEEWNSAGGAPDPFAAPTTEESELPIGIPRKTDPKKALEFFGVVFGPGSDATYDRKSCALRVTQTPDQMEVREVGTIAEIDAVLGPDDQTIDLNLSLEHHTAPPTFSRVEVPIPGSSEPATVDLPAFHVNSILTQVTIMSGDTKLLVSWRPTGKPEFESKDVMRIVFLRADAGRAG